jgi:hypothetical protein
MPVQRVLMPKGKLLYFRSGEHNYDTKGNCRLVLLACCFSFSFVLIARPLLRREGKRCRYIRFSNTMHAKCVSIKHFAAQSSGFGPNNPSFITRVVYALLFFQNCEASHIRILLGAHLSNLHVVDMRAPTFYIYASFAHTLVHWGKELGSRSKIGIGMEDQDQE